MSNMFSSTSAGLGSPCRSHGAPCFGKRAGTSWRSTNFYMRVSIVMGVPNSWLVYFMQNPFFNMDDLGVARF